MLRGIQPKEKHPRQMLSFMGFPHGLNTSMPIFQIVPTECSALINWIIKKGGKLVTRDPISKYTTSATTNSSAVKTIAQVNIGSTTYILIQDAAHKIYYLDADLKPVLIDTLAANAQIIGYNGVAIIMDGSFLKYIDTVASGIKIAYDAGTGATGFQFDHSALTNDTYLALGNGTNLGVAQKFTTQAWTAGYTIPPVTVTAYLSEDGSAPTGAITAKIRATNDSSTVLASKTFVTDAADIGATAVEFSTTFTSGDISTELSPSTAYFMSLEYSAGDATNYVKVHCNNIGSGGLSYYGITDLNTIGNWTADTAKHCLMSLSPGMPPKGSFAAIKDARLFMAGDPDNPGYVWYSNLTHLDWSTASGGGYIGAVDDHKNNYKIGGINILYGDLLVYGTEAQPYLSKLTGASPSDYALPLSFQRAWTTSKTLVSAANDLWAGSGDGVDPVSGVQEYGDLRTFSASDPIADRLDDYWDSDTAFAAYFPRDGQYWLVMPKYYRVLTAHTKNPTVDPSGQGVRYPWSEQEFYRDILTSGSYKWVSTGAGTNEYECQAAAGGDPSIGTQPDFLILDGAVITEGTAGSLNDHEWDYALDQTSTFYTVHFRDESGDPDTTGVTIRSVLLPTALASAGSLFLIGGSDGFVYQIDSSKYKDLGSYQISPKLGSAYMEVPFTYANFTQFQLFSSSIGGGQVGLDIYVDGKRVTASVTNILSTDDGLTVDQAIMDVDDAYFSIDIKQAQLFKYINVNARSIMFVVKDVILSGYPIYLSGTIFKYRELSY